MDGQDVWTRNWHNLGIQICNLASPPREHRIIQAELTRFWEGDGDKEG